MSTESEIRSCGVLVMTRSSPRKFLLMRHTKRWDLPKGHVDEGEETVTGEFTVADEVGVRDGGAGGVLG